MLVDDTDRAKFVELEGESGDKVGNELLEWLLDNGAEFPKLYLREYASEVRGVHASSALARDEEIMRIPLKCLITVEMGKDTDIGQMLIDRNVSFVAPKHIFLMMFLLTDMEKGKTSFFYHYYQTLPQELTNMPIFWSETELNWLKGSYILKQIQDRKNSIAKDYHTICEIDPSFQRFSLDRFKWARMLVCSRNFGLNIKGRKTAALVPLADMLNHYRPRETTWTFNQSRNSFTITTLDQISSGAQVYDSYGKKCNHRFLLNYGFAVQDNAEDGHNPNEVMVHMDLLPKDPLHVRKKELLSRDGNYYLDTRMSMRCSDANVREGFSFARLIVAGETELDQIQDHKYITHQIPPLNRENEARALELLQNLMLEQLSKYDTTLEQDESKLKSNLELFSNECQALIFMRGEKQVCQYYVDQTREMVPLLQLSNRAYRQTIMKHYAGEDDLSRYAQMIGATLMKGLMPSCN